MKKSHLLINEPALQVLPSLAEAIGLEESIIVQQLHYWLNNDKVGVERDGEKWIFNTYEEWQENFPFWSVQKIKRLFLSIEEKGVIISAQLDAKKHDMRKFYRIDYGVLCTMECIKSEPSNVSKVNDVNKNTKTTTENTATGTEPTNIFALYEQNIGMITPVMADALKDAEGTYCAEWISDAIRIAVENNKRNWKYCEAILKRWQADGKDDGKRKTDEQRPRYKAQKQSGPTALEKYAKEQGIEV